MCKVKLLKFIKYKKKNRIKHKNSSKLDQNYTSRLQNSNMDQESLNTQIFIILLTT